MFERFQSDGETSAEHLVASGYWPARAAQFLADGTWSRAVEICKESLDEEPGCCSGRLIYARALYHAGQVESATEQFYRVLALDAENIVALKYLGDIKFTEHDEPAALAHYRRVLEIDPYCHALTSPIKSSRPETTRTITLTRGGESRPTIDKRRGTLRKIPFYTETVGDLYLTQGHSRLAAEVFRGLYEKKPTPQLLEKLEQAQRKIHVKEKTHVDQTD